MSDKQTTVIEINGVKLEVDLRHAVRVDQLKIGSRVKCLVKKYNDFVTCPGVIVGFEPFKALPTICVAYIENEFTGTDIVFKSFNSSTEGFEVVQDLDNNSLEINRADILERLDRDIAKKRLEIKEIEHKREFFISKFGKFFGEDSA